MATAHLLHGFVGAGKTTFAKKLELEANAVRFTPDEWMIALHGANPPADQFQMHHQRILDVIWQQAARVLVTGTDVIFDFGFWKRVERDLWRTRVAAAGAETKLYVLHPPFDIMKTRVLDRTKEMPEGALFIDENAINLFWGMFEHVDPLTEDVHFSSISS